MSQTTALYRRIRRRETHSSRSGLAITLAVIVILTCSYGIVEMVLHLAGQPALINDMFGAANAAAGLAAYTPGIVITTGALTALIGVIIMIASLTAGRRARHLIDTEMTSAMVDNAVIASALARHAAQTGKVSPDNATVSVSRRSAVVTLTPTFGTAIDASAVTRAVHAQLDSYALTPKVRPRVIIKEQAKVGS
jgi:hypothetical protein